MKFGTELHPHESQASVLFISEESPLIFIIRQLPRQIFFKLQKPTKGLGDLCLLIFVKNKSGI